MFSGRLPARFDPNALALLLETKRRVGARLIDLTESNPTRVGLAPGGEEIAAAFADRVIARYEPDPRGLPSARDAVAAYYSERGLAVRPERIVLTASTSEAYAHLFRLLGDPGDEFLVPRPSYPLFEPLAALEAVRLVPYALRYERRWTLDPSEVASLVGPRTRGLIVVHPNNPTGSFVDAASADALEALCARRGIALIADEVFGDFALEDAGAAAAARRASFADATRPLAFALSGLSKVAGLPQIKAAWIVAAGPDALVDQALDRLDWIADAFLSVSTPAMRALPRLLAGRHAFRERALARLRENRRALAAGLAARPDVEALPVEGGWCAVLRLPRTRTEEAWALALLACDVLVHPGHFYDFPDEAYVVVSLLAEPAAFAEGIGRLVEVAGEEPR
jgi:aspartate/methionine/tyrosine aminotransferase